MLCLVLDTVFLGGLCCGEYWILCFWWHMLWLVLDNVSLVAYAVLSIGHCVLVAYVVLSIG